ncbi:MAG TPA: kelch repeat-containing protein, partial [Thermoplasmata archaeon]|nr:kelch repeat-containing protein [Thermoplasmata archaeon]
MQKAACLVLVALVLVEGIPTAFAPISARAPHGPTFSVRPAPSHTAPAIAPRSSATPTGSAASPLGRTPGLCTVDPLPWCPRFDRSAPQVPSPLADATSSWKNLSPIPYPASYPSPRSGASLAYSPDLHGSLLFGGSATGGLAQDTWLYSGGNWSELVAPTTCTVTTCPSPRTDAMMTYDLTDHEAVLFGGLNQYGFPAGVLGDTWAFAGGSWKNITSTVGTAPSPRYDGSMVFDSGDGYVLLFGGANSTGVPVGQTWKFTAGHWTNLTGSLTQAPEAREGAAIADSPLGWVMLFGGLGVTSVIQNNYYSTGGPYVVWWFHNGSWLPAVTPVAPHAPTGAAGASEYFGPCGRFDAALAWSPKNDRFVVFGGLGTPGTTYSCASSIFSFPLNDTYVYTNTLGSGFTYWYNDTTPGAPSPRSGMGYTSDYSAG